MDDVWTSARSHRYVERELGFVLARRTQGRRRRRHQAALGPLLRTARAAGGQPAAGARPTRLRRGGSRPERLPQLLRACRSRPVPPAGRPRRPLEGPVHHHDPQGGRPGAAPDPDETRGGPGAGRVGRGGRRKRRDRRRGHGPDPRPGAVAGVGPRVRRGLRPPLRAARGPDVEDDRPAQARGTVDRGGRRLVEGVEADHRPQAPADPRHLGMGRRGPHGMNAHRTIRGADLPLADRKWIDAACDRFEAAFREGGRPDLASFLADADPPARIRARLFRELLALDLDYGREEGEPTDVEGYRARFPEFLEVIDAAITLDGTTGTGTCTTSVQPDGSTLPDQDRRRP